MSLWEIVGLTVGLGAKCTFLLTSMLFDFVDDPSSFLDSGCFDEEVVNRFVHVVIGLEDIVCRRKNPIAFEWYGVCELR